MKTQEITCSSHVNQTPNELGRSRCLDFAANYHERMFLESWYTKSDNNGINICRDMPGAYYSLIISERTRADSREQTRELSADASQ